MTKNIEKLNKDEVATLAISNLDNILRIEVSRVGNVFVTTVVNGKGDGIEAFTSWRFNFDEGTATALDLVVVNKVADKLVRAISIEGPVFDVSDTCIQQLIAKIKAHLQGLAILKVEQKRFLKNM